MNNYPKAWQIDDNKSKNGTIKWVLLFAFDKLYQESK
jgi:hypothetical protein